ncbi:hypothetical protein GCM10010862_08700 [Devosia nitrariae]|uniref:Uncharacterized protein n=2 Tax=Devosia nitrariae TaxID=2071872 RepID=A0ABQ5W1L4_9HYPH|nr:hypothetical protein GCM10010862_08700 [Devosia nitrariae]
MTESTDSVDLPIAPAKQRAARRRAAADATAKWRGIRRAVGMPEAAHVDRAITEAMSFCLQPVYAQHDGTGVFVSLERTFRTAVLILMRNGADRELAQQAVRNRLAPRPHHSELHHVPSLVMHVDGFEPLARRGDIPWSEVDKRAMAAASRPRNHGV